MQVRERERREIARREKKMKDFRNKQDIGLFLDLLSHFKYESSYLEKNYRSIK